MEPIYCTALPHTHLPEHLKLKFRDLDHLFRELVSSAVSRVTLVAPFWSVAGIDLLEDSLLVALERGAVVRLVVDARTDAAQLRGATMWLSASGGGYRFRDRVRLLRSTDLITFVHAKMILIDGAKGYLGSANITAGGLQRNFELGVQLDASQAEALEGMIAVFEAKGLLRDDTSCLL